MRKGLPAVLLIILFTGIGFAAGFIYHQNTGQFQGIACIGKYSFRYLYESAGRKSLNRIV